MVAAGRGRTFLEDLSVDLTQVAALLAHYAEQDARRRAAEAVARVTARQVEAVQAARYARCAVFGADLADPGWSLLLALFRAYLEKRPVRLGRLATDARGPRRRRFAGSICSPRAASSGATPIRSGTGR